MAYYMLTFTFTFDIKLCNFMEGKSRQNFYVDVMCPVSVLESFFACAVFKFLNFEIHFYPS
jgi:hypothetical protein